VALRRFNRTEDLGLPTLKQAREERRRAFVFGKARMPALPPQFFLWAGVLIAVFIALYWRMAQGELESAKGRVMAKQRAVAQTLGPKVFPFRDAIERWVRELGGAYAGDHVAASASLSDVTTKPGVYLRLRVENAATSAKIQEASKGSLLDGFTSCMFVRKGAWDATKGKACKVSADCVSHELCNEWKVCAPPPRPYNLRLLYRALRVLSPAWTDELHEADSELGVTAFERDLESVTQTDVPVAIDVFTHAKLFTVVLDETPPSGLPAELPDAGETKDERIQRVPHFSRVGIWDLETKQLLLRLRREPGVDFVQVQGQRTLSPTSIAAQKRQTQSCGLALEVKRALGDSTQLGMPGGP
jgi:hypothetical protein